MKYILFLIVKGGNGIFVISHVLHDIDYEHVPSPVVIVDCICKARCVNHCKPKFHSSLLDFHCWCFYLYCLVNFFWKPETSSFRKTNNISAWIGSLGKFGSLSILLDFPKFSAHHRIGSFIVSVRSLVLYAEPTWWQHLCFYLDANPLSNKTRFGTRS